ncbi:hypothetical protein ACFQPA_00170 [Halomarina halobia]|uniref:DUF8056 domain-containing protein n=1 Tax=Halomarina halobia TaxID=3033386 RepID=A0ABD6A866_9EURY|nr:hypothetical protein [Halomarina sp. PSR21]
MSTATEERTYRGLFGAFPYAFRSSDSLLFKLYVVVGGFLAFAVGSLFGLALVVLLGSTAAAGAGSFTFVRPLFIVVGLFAVAPLLAPVLFVARHHRRGTHDARYDRLFAATGFLFILSLYLAAVITTPADQQARSAGAVAVLLYSLPRPVGLLPPIAVAVGMYLLHRHLR